MSAIKNYFSYRCSIHYGIPEVTLMGTLDDWKELRDKIDGIAEYGKESNQDDLIWWQDILIPIAEEFINSYEGRVNEKFWRSCANYIGGSSGPSYVSGWCRVFASYSEGNWRLRHPDMIKITRLYGKIETSCFDACATVKVPLKVNDNGREYDAYFYAGGIVNTYDDINNTLRPSFDFAMFEVTKGTVPDEID